MLLATGGGNLVYVEVGDGQLTETKSIQLHKEISCLDMHPIGELGRFRARAPPVAP